MDKSESGYREITITRILGQSFAVGPLTIRLVAIARNKARLVVTVPNDLDVEDFNDFEQIIKSTIVMQDDRGWRRAINKAQLERPPDHPEKEDTRPGAK